MCCQYTPKIYSCQVGNKNIYACVKWLLRKVFIICKDTVFRLEYRTEKCIFLFNIHKVLNVFEHIICMYLTKIQEFKGMIEGVGESGVKGRMRE